MKCTFAPVQLQMQETLTLQVAMSIDTFRELEKVCSELQSHSDYEVTLSETVSFLINEYNVLLDKFLAALDASSKEAQA